MANIVAAVLSMQFVLHVA